MEESNLQCVEHVVDFKLNKDKDGVDVDPDHCRINARDFFLPTQVMYQALVPVLQRTMHHSLVTMFFSDNWLLLAADYSQIELRLMAHFSRDSSLIELLSMPEGDVFTMMAARLTGRAEALKILFQVLRPGFMKRFHLAVKMGSWRKRSSFGTLKKKSRSPGALSGQRVIERTCNAIERTYDRAHTCRIERTLRSSARTHAIERKCTGVNSKLQNPILEITLFWK